MHRNPRLRLLVLHSMVFRVPVFPNQAATALTSLQHELLFATRHNLMKGEKEIPEWYTKQLERESASPGMVITDRPEVKVTLDESSEEVVTEPVPKPAAFFSNPSEWVRE